MPIENKWIIKNKAADCTQISKKLSISEITAKVLVNKGFSTYEEALYYLNPDINKLPDPYEITQMREAVSTVKRHMNVNNKIAVFADYDADGITSTAIVLKCLNYENSIFYIPNRITEGYGLNAEAVRKLHNNGVSLIIACDNGISAINESHLIYELGMELIVIDHHEPPYDKNGNDILPRAEAIVNPKRSDCTYAYKSMCAAGLCLRFSEALTGTIDEELLVFAAIATICDIVDLTGDNRVIVKKGLELIGNTCNLGLRHLINMYELKTISTYHIGFIIGPSINASGRIGNAETAVELLLTNNGEKAAQIVKELYDLNAHRKNLTEAAVKQLTDKIETSGEKVFVIYCPNVHESIAGIAAGRIKEAYNHPSVVITKGEGYAKGSARSIDGYNIFDALTEVSDLLIKFGGHAGAAGFSLRNEDINALRSRLNENCKITDFTPKLYIDARLPINEITMELAEELATLGPFGKGNTEPVFAEKCVKFSKIEFLGKDKTVIKLTPLNAEGVTAIAFGLYDKFMSVMDECGLSDTSGGFAACPLTLDIVFAVTINEFRGTRSVQFVLKDIRKSES